MEERRDINRLKVVLAEKKRTNKWLAETLGKDQATVSKWCTNTSQPKDQATVSKWCTNTSQPSLEMLLRIAEVLEVDMKDLLWPLKELK